MINDRKQWFLLWFVALWGLSALILPIIAFGLTGNPPPPVLFWYARASGGHAAPHYPDALSAWGERNEDRAGEKPEENALMVSMETGTDSFWLHSSSWSMGRSAVQRYCSLNPPSSPTSDETGDAFPIEMQRNKIEPSAKNLADFFYSLV
jgi:hypothetical protein